MLAAIRPWLLLIQPWNSHLRNKREVMMKRTYWTLAIATVAILIAATAGRSTTAGTAAAQDKAAQESAIKIDNFSFSPATVTIHVGDTDRKSTRLNSSH